MKFQLDGNRSQIKRPREIRHRYDLVQEVYKHVDIYINVTAKHTHIRTQNLTRHKEANVHPYFVTDLTRIHVMTYIE